MLRQITGTYKPTMATRKPGVLTPSVFQGTGTSPSMEIMERARIWEERTRDAYVSVAYGFAYADVPDIGATVMVVTNNDQALADRIADDMSDFIWKKREEFAGKKLPKTKEGVAHGDRRREGRQGAGRRRRPVGPHRQLDAHPRGADPAGRAGTSASRRISDEKAINEIKAKAKVGDQVTVNVGGYQDQYAGKPVPITGKVEFLGKYGGIPDGGGAPVREQQPRDPDAGAAPGDRPRHLRAARHRPEDARHHRPQVARALLARLRRGRPGEGGVRMDAPGLGPADVTTIPYKNAPKDLYPLVRR